MFPQSAAAAWHAGEVLFDRGASVSISSTQDYIVRCGQERARKVLLEITVNCSSRHRYPRMLASNHVRYRQKEPF